MSAGDDIERVKDGPHFDRCLCACGAMHYFCGECGVQDDDCSDAFAPAVGPAGAEAAPDPTGGVSR